MTHLKIALGLLLILAAKTAARELDAFDDPSFQQAQARWVAAEKTPHVEVVQHGKRHVLQFQLPAGPEIRRAVIDRRVDWDLRADSGFELELQVDHPEVASSVTLYFHDQDGWWAQSQRLTQTGWLRLTFPKDRFRAEDQPGNWSRIDGVRIALWRSGTAAGAATVQLRRFAAIQHPIAIVLEESETEAGLTCRQAGERIEALLAQAGLPVDRIPQDRLDDAHLGQRRIVIFPYNPRLSPKTIEFLAHRIEDGLKIVTCYDLPRGLDRAIGIKRGSYFRPVDKRELAQIRPANPRLPGFPPIVRQASWNVVSAIPQTHGARVVAWWHDAQGNRTDHAAWVLSDRGAYFSHVILDDDPLNKQAMLAAVLGKLDQQVWQTIAQSRSTAASRIGHLTSVEQWRRWTASSSDPQLASIRKECDELEQEIQRTLDGKQFFAASGQIAELDQLRRRGYRLAMTHPQTEARAWWNHSGTGAYPGDWERTADELSEAGFNMIIPNMLWGGAAHYASDVLPRSRTFDQYGDQIKQCVAAAHRHGIEVHVWKVNFNLGHHAPREFVERLRKAGRLQVSHDGQPLDWLNPAHPDNVRLEVDSMLELVRKYDIDGIHFDYIRYPNRDHDYSDYSRQAFEQTLGRRVAAWPADCYSGKLAARYAQWRRDQITHVVAEVSRRARRIKPDIKISAAVFGGYPDCRETVAQDWVLWAERGYLDFVCPMNYSSDNRAFVAQLERQRRALPEGFPLYTGIGATASRSRLDAEQVLGQMHLARQVGAQGFVIFNLDADTLHRIGSALGESLRHANRSRR